MTSQTTSTPFDMWKEFAQKSSDFWGKATTPPAADPAQPWRQILSMWSDTWTKHFVQAPSPDLFQQVQKQWSEQLEALAQALANIMGTDTFAAAQSQYLEQSLTWLDKLTKACHPQADMALRALNLPSREQIDRLFERLVALEERLDDLDDTTRNIARRLREKRAAESQSGETV